MIDKPASSPSVLRDLALVVFVAILALLVIVSAAGGGAGVKLGTELQAHALGGAARTRLPPWLSDEPRASFDEAEEE